MIQPSQTGPSSPNTAATIRVAQVSSLSAMGSISLPSSVTWLYLRAIHPSTLSVDAATMNSTAAAHRMGMLFSPHEPAAMYRPRNITTSTMREYVTRFGGAFQPSSSDFLAVAERSVVSFCISFSIVFTIPPHSYLG